MKTASISRKSTLFLVPMLLATSAAMGDSVPADAQAQAASLLSRPYSIGTASAGPAFSASVKSSSTDGQAKAAALLSRPRTDVGAPTAVVTHLSGAVRSADGQSQAAALLSRPRTI
jgi:hypothetical protein